ncbi:MAG: Em GEA1 (EM1) [Candidatus Sericytochromatia bacterium]|nr:Em GEA1 (EM1) [Candidatus Sericytochromatia bacterium]
MAKPANQNLTVREAGHMGGAATKQEVETGELPKDFYSAIGRKGGQQVKELIAKGKEAGGDSGKT